MQKVFFHSADRTLNIAGKTKIKDFLLRIFKKEKTSLGRIDYIFCSDDYLLSINQKHLNHDYYTDIITFDLSASQKITAEVYISIDRVKENSKTLKTGFRQELLRVIFHGVLHLCGYQDKTKVQKVIMRLKEQQYMDIYSK